MRSTGSRKVDGDEPLPLGQRHVDGQYRGAALASRAPVNLLEAIVLGLVQGLTEFLPIRLTAHLRIVPGFLGLGDPGRGVLRGHPARHAGRGDHLLPPRPLAAHHRRAAQPSATQHSRCKTTKEPAGLVRGPGHHPHRRSSACTFEDQIETGARDLWLIGTTLIVFAPRSCGYADRRRPPRARDRAALERATPTLIGLAQALHPDPGRVALGRDHLHGARPLGMARAPAAARFSVPARGPRRGAERAVRAPGRDLRREGRRRAARRT